MTIALEYQREICQLAYPKKPRTQLDSQRKKKKNYSITPDYIPNTDGTSGPQTSTWCFKTFRDEGVDGLSQLLRMPSSIFLPGRDLPASSWYKRSVYLVPF